MPTIPPEQIARSPYKDFVAILNRYASERDMLIYIKQATEKVLREARTPENRRHMAEKLQEVDNYLRKVKHTKTPGTSPTGEVCAFVYVLDLGEGAFHAASMHRPAQYLANLCRTIKDPDEVPRFISFIPQPDIDSIPADWWDDTCPTVQEPAQPEFESLHQTFSL